MPLQSNDRIQFLSRINAVIEARLTNQGSEVNEETLSKQTWSDEEIKMAIAFGF